jgi:hypothetical protein
MATNTNERSCSICGCTDRFGCQEGCYWVESTTIPICSVCAGVTKMHRRSYTRTAAAAKRPDVPAGQLGIFNPVGRLVGLAWHVSEAQAMARGIDAYYQGLRQHADLALGRTVWRRGPIRYRKTQHLAKGASK